MARLKKAPASKPKAKETAAPPPPPVVEEQPEPEKQMFPSSLPEELESLSTLIDGREHLLATDTGDEELSKNALKAVKGIFDLGLSLEKDSHPHLHPLLASILAPPSMSTRSSTTPTKRARKKSTTDTSETAPAAPDPSTLLPYTPLDALYTDGMDLKQIWQQLELRASKLGEVLKGIGIGAGAEEGEGDEENEENDAAAKARQRAMGISSGEDDGEDDDEDEGDDDDDEELDLDDPDLTPEEKKMWERLMKERPEMFSEREEGSDHEDDLNSDSNSEDDEDEDEDDEDDSESSGDEQGEGDGLYSDEDDDMEGFDDLSNSNSDADGEDPLESGDIDMDASVSGSDQESELAPPRRGPTHPTLDDQFFSIDEFNALTEEAEAGKMTSGSLGSKSKSKVGTKGKSGEVEEEDDTDDEMEEGGDLAALLASGDVLEGGSGGAEADMMYSDFFAPPPKQWTKENPNKDSSKSKNGKDKSKSDPKGKGKGKNGSSAEDEQASAPIAESTDLRSTMHRVRNDLFADDDEDASTKPNLSTHHKRQLALQEQIASLEQENVGQKDWVLMGEVKARDRPENGLLEEELDFEHTGKVVPLITEERVLSLEEIIKKRILDENFDDVVRRREIDDKAFLPSRFFELQDSQASKSLAQIYEDEYTAGASGTKTVDPRDAKLLKDHEEIDKLWGEISYKLDALSNLNFTPKQPKAAITTISNVATTTLESALPTTQSTSTMLAPEELFAPPSSSALVSRSELDSGEKRRARQKSRKHKMHERQALDSAVDKYSGKGGGGGKARGGVKAQKDRALEELVKSGKGVTVVGKDSVRKRGTRPDASTTAPSATFKL